MAPGQLFTKTKNMNARDYLQNTVAGFLHSIIEPLEALITSDETNRKRLAKLEEITRAMDTGLTATNETFSDVNNHNAKRITALEEYNRTSAEDISRHNTRIATLADVTTCDQKATVKRLGAAEADIDDLQLAKTAICNQREVDAVHIATLQTNEKATSERVTLAMERIEILENKHDLVSIAQFLNRLELAETCQERQRTALEGYSERLTAWEKETQDTQTAVADLRRIIGNHISAQNNDVADREAVAAHAAALVAQVERLEKQRRLDETSLENLREQLQTLTTAVRAERNQVTAQQEAIRQLNAENAHLAAKVKQWQKRAARNAK